MIQELNQEQQKLISTEPYSWIYVRAGRGAGDATPAEAILFGFSLTDRDLRKCIETMRRAGIIIASSSKGYYLPATRKELEEYIKRTEKAARSIFATLKYARRALKKTESCEIRNERH